MDELTIRQAIPAEAVILSDIAFRSKGHWGYDAEYMELARFDLSVSENSIQNNRVYVIDVGARICGFYECRKNTNLEVELFWLFVDPQFIGKGYGKILMKHAVQLAKSESFQHMKIKSDANATKFYEGFGAVVVGETSSTVRPEMKLPIMKLAL